MDGGTVANLPVEQKLTLAPLSDRLKQRRSAVAIGGPTTSQPHSFALQQA